jgi:hypothetical protein
MRKIVSVFICALLICTLFFAGLSCIGEVQAVSKPSVPQFTVKVVDSSHDTEPYTVTTIDEYTGKETTITHPSYHVDQRSIEFTIKNQPFTPYTNEYGNDCRLYYHIEAKGHFGGEWVWFAGYPVSVYQSDSAYTTLSVVSQYEAGSQLDFRVQAVILYELSENSESEWSKIQTLTIPAYNNEAPNQNEPTPNPTYTSDQNETQTDLMTIQLPLIGFLLVLILCPVIIVVLIIALIYTRKTSRHKQTAQT